MKITLGNRNINIKIEKKKRKTISIKIVNSEEILISTPLYLSNDKILEILKEKNKWITDKLKLAELNTPKERNLEYIKFLGQEYKIELNTTYNKNIKVEIVDNKLLVGYPEELKDREANLREALIAWYKTQAGFIYRERVEYYSKLLRVCPKKITIKEQKTRWGSCSSKGNLNFNWRVVMAPIEVVNYLVVHELCHLIQMNHSKEFWSLVKSVLPDYKKYESWLKLNGNNLMI